MGRGYILKTLLWVFLIASIIGTSACSAIFRRDIWQAETTNTDWVPLESNDYRASYKFQREEVIITAEFWYRVWILSLGPPFFPVIPRSHKYQTNIILNLTITSESDEARIDLAKIQLQISGNTSVRLKKASAGEPDGAPQEIPVMKVAVSNGPRFYLQFNPFDSVPPEFILDLGSIEINDKTFKLPPLKCQKRFKYSYWPLFMDHLGEKDED
jgi:hypothetical protein